MKEKGHYRWVAGVSVIMVALIFLLRNLTGMDLGNWWALLMLIPAVMFFSRAWAEYKAENSITPVVRNSGTVGIFITLTALIMLFGFSFSVWWPVFAIVVGIGLFLR